MVTLCLPPKRYSIAGYGSLEAIAAGETLPYHYSDGEIGGQVDAPPSTEPNFGSHSHLISRERNCYRHYKHKIKERCPSSPLALCVRYATGHISALAFHCL
jgi:hypothetical protein